MTACRCLAILLGLGLGCGDLLAAAENFKFTGRDYVVELGEKLDFSLRSGNDWRQALGEIRFEAFTKNFAQLGWRTGGIESMKVTALEAGCQQVDAVCKVTGEYAADARIELSLLCRPDFLRLAYTGALTGEVKRLEYCRVALGHGHDLERPFVCGEQRLKVAAGSGRNLWRSAGHSGVSLLWPPADPARFGEVLLLIPYREHEPVVADFQRSGRLDACRLGVELVPTEQHNLFFPGQTPYLRLRLQNYADQPQVLTYSLTANDFRQRHKLQAAGRVEIGGGEWREEQVPLDTDWPGYAQVELLGDGAGRHWRLPSQIGRIPDPARAHRAESIFGIQDFTWYQRTDASLDLMQWLGAHWVRGLNGSGDKGTEWQAPYAEAEGEPTDPARVEAWLNRYQSRGLEPIPTRDQPLRLPPGLFTYTETCNEPNLRQVGAEFAEQMKIHYIKLKQHDPRLLVGSPGTAQVDEVWYQELAENGCWEYMDFINVHLHCFPNAPEVDNSLTRYYWLAAKVKNLRQLMNQHGAKPVFDTEHGTLTLDPDYRPEHYRLGAVAPDNMAAAFMVRAYLEALAYGLQGKQWFLLSDYGGFGLTHRDTPRPGYCAYAQLTKVLDGARYVGDLVAAAGAPRGMLEGPALETWFGLATPELEPAKPDSAKPEPGETEDPSLKPRVYQVVFRRPDGSALIAAYATLKRREVVKANPGTEAWRGQEPGIDQWWNGRQTNDAPEPVRTTLYVGRERVRIGDLMGEERMVETPGGRLEIALDDYPVFITDVDPGLLEVAAKNNRQLFSAEVPATHGSPLIQVLLPPGGKFPKREKGAYDTHNLSARLKVGERYEFTPRLTNLSAQAQEVEVALELPAGWELEPAAVRVTVAPGQTLTGAAFSVRPKTAAELARIIARATAAGMSVAPSVLRVAVSE